jgi:YesN/AraC family two-component response regulator
VPNPGEWGRDDREVATWRGTSGAFFSSTTTPLSGHRFGFFWNPHGYAVQTAPNGRVGTRLFADAEPDLVITDIIMPEQEGIETIMRLRGLRPDKPIIAISGGGRVRNADFLQMAACLGASAVLAKPFDGNDLIRKVETCLAA